MSKSPAERDQMNAKLPGHPGGKGPPGPAGRSHGSELVEELHRRTAASRIRAKGFSLIVLLNLVSPASAGRGTCRSKFKSKVSLTLGIQLTGLGYSLAYG
jgi:hypothetical protein